MKNPFLIGKKIYLRLHDKKDIPVWFKWFNDSDVTRFLVHGCYPNTKELQKAFFKNMYGSRSNFQLAIVDKKTGDLAGTIGLHKIDLINRNADISIVIGDKRYWGKKIGKEAVALIASHAFDKLNLHKVTAGMVDGNKASYNLFASLGFKKEGVLKEQNFADGRYQDVVRFGLLRKDYEKNFNNRG